MEALMERPEIERLARILYPLEEYPAGYAAAVSDAQADGPWRALLRPALEQLSRLLPGHVRGDGSSWRVKVGPGEDDWAAVGLDPDYQGDLLGLVIQACTDRQPAPWLLWLTLEQTRRPDGAWVARPQIRVERRPALTGTYYGLTAVFALLEALKPLATPRE